jgi:hypothetical protein
MDMGARAFYCRTAVDRHSGHFGSCTPLNVLEQQRTVMEHGNCNRDVTAAIFARE